MDKTNAQYTSSGREVKKVGANQKSKDALAQLRNARDGNAKRTD